MTRTTKETRLVCLLEPLWDYLAVSNSPRPADVIFVFGCADRAVPERAAQLYHQGHAPRVLVTGRYGRMTKGVFDKPEALVFKDHLVDAGVPEASIITEPEAANTLENVQLGMSSLAQCGAHPRSALLVAKGFVMRRCVATFAQQFSQVHVYPCPPGRQPQAPLDRSLPELAARLVAEVERLERYAAQGDIRSQPIPGEVRMAAHRVEAALRDS